MPDSLPLSVVIITRDAARDIAECLACVPFAAEALVVDSGSRDDTVQAARACGARVVEHEWLGFGPQKNFATAAAEHDWVLCVDADERVSPELARSIRGLFAAGYPSHRGYAIARRNRFLGRWLAHGEGYPDWNVRLFDRRAGRWSDEPVHERVHVDGAVARLHGDLLHFSGESVESYIDKQNRYTTIQAQAMHARGEHASAARLFLSPFARFVRFYLLKLGFLDGAAGFAHVAIGAFASFLKYAKLRALDVAERTR
ncbi:MAG TPA: glycosyltransferase family 2 protein [Casimicrobiaceae bacterium]|nr:glycosyltransferase family 2 protein [Casimicrobiaceae bacterium]